MYLIYVDDCGKPQEAYRHNSYFCLSAVVVHERGWKDIDNSIINLKNKHGINNIHTRDMYRMEKEFSYLNNNPDQRFDILGDIFSLISRINVKLISSVIDKNEYYNQQPIYR